MKIFSIILLSGSFALAACGTNGVPSQSPANKAAASTAPSALNLPAAALVRVPVDANGVENTAKAELRLHQSDAVVSDKEAVAAAWDKAQVPASVKTQDELDSSSSTPSWFYYHHGYYGNHYGYGYNYYPSYYYYGRPYYYYTYPSYYYYGGYNYYYYPRPYGWGC